MTTKLCILSLILFATAALSFGQTRSVLIPVTPCRVVDTRQTSGPLGGPEMLAGTTRSFPVPTGTCAIPTTASAYSLNVTVVPNSTLQYLTIWPTGQAQPIVSTLNSYTGLVIANAAIVPAGTSGAVSVYVTDETQVIIDIDGYFTRDQTDVTTQSTAYGNGALINDNSVAGNNSAFGAYALSTNTAGTYNTASGGSALIANTTGSYNTAAGAYALVFNTTGFQNTASGTSALYSNTTGSFNTALGYQAGYNVTTGSDNIEIANQGSSTDYGVIRIGTPTNQTSTFISGISGVTVTGSAVIVNSSGQLGVASSSRKYKEDVEDIGDDYTKALMRLRPVSFRYKGTAPLQYGLIAEEVDQVIPSLVSRDSNGDPMSVQYHELPALLLSELQRQRKMIDEQRKFEKKQSAVVDRLEKRLAEVESRLPKQ